MAFVAIAKDGVMQGNVWQNSGMIFKKQKKNSKREALEKKAAKLG